MVCALHAPSVHPRLPPTVRCDVCFAFRARCHPSIQSIQPHTTSAHLWPISTAISLPGCRTSHTLMHLSTLPVAIRHSSYLHQSAVST